MFTNTIDGRAKPSSLKRMPKRCSIQGIYVTTWGLKRRKAFARRGHIFEKYGICSMNLLIITTSS